MRLGQVRCALHPCCPFFVELPKLFLVLENLLQEFFAPRTPPYLLPRPHLGFKAVKSACLSLTRGEHLCSFVEVAVHELPLVEKVASALGKETLKHVSVCVEVLEETVTEGLLLRAELNHFLVKLCLLLHLGRGVATGVFNESLQSLRQVSDCIDSVGCAQREVRVVRVASRRTRMLVNSLRVAQCDLAPIGEFAFHVLPHVVEEHDAIGFKFLGITRHRCALLDLLLEGPVGGWQI